MSIKEPEVNREFTEAETVRAPDLNLSASGLLTLDKEGLKQTQELFGHVKKGGAEKMAVKTSRVAECSEIAGSSEQLAAEKFDFSQLFSFNKGRAARERQKSFNDPYKGIEFGRGKSAVGGFKLLFLGALCFVFFCLLMVSGVIYASSVFSKAITESALESTAKIVDNITQTIPEPIEKLNVAALEQAASADAASKGDSSRFLGAWRNDPDELEAATGAGKDELAAFDSLISYVTEKSKNPIIMEVFSGQDGASVLSTAEGYNLWAYITDVKKKSGMDFDAGVALLEAASLVKYSRENKVPLPLSVGVAQTESSFNPGAYSNKSACGPMQVVYDIHKGLLSGVGINTKEELFTADKGVQAGCYLLGRYLKAEKNVTGGLKRYYGALAPEYINKVLSHRHAFELFASGLEKDFAAAIKKEDLNWEKMSRPSLPAIKAPTQKNTKSASVSSGQAVKKPAAQNGLTVKPGSGRTQDNQMVFSNTGTIIILDEQGRPGAKFGLSEN